jgi:hypothetical protein
MTRTSSRLSAALVLIALLALSLPVSAVEQPRRVPEALSWVQSWVDTLWSLFSPESPKPVLAVGQDDSPTALDRGALIDPNGGGRR